MGLIVPQTINPASQRSKAKMSSQMSKVKSLVKGQRSKVF